jgi:ribosomal protein S12 methylthiotransferase accessory factor
LISPLTGIVNYLHPMPGRHFGLRKVYVSGYQVCPQALSADNAFDKICAGKGQSDEQAQASALCEALERASSVWQGDEWLRVCSRAELLSEGANALPFDILQNFSPQQFAQRESINALSSDRRRQVPLAASDESVLGWTRAWSLTGQGAVYVPAVYCFAEPPMQLGGLYGIYNPNGTAAGNCSEEAVFQGLLELVERDAVAIWWYNQIPRPALNLQVLHDSFVDALHREYSAEGWRLQVLDLTHDLGIAVYAAVAHHPQQQRYAIGFGCHLQPRLAVSRALTELNQLLDSSRQTPPPWDTTLLPKADFLHPTEFSDHLPSALGGIDLKQDIETCLQRLTAAGIDTYLVNKSRPDIGLAVVQVIAPGLRHFWPRFGSGRLYQVPVKMGWLAQCTAETQLNAAALFL